MHECMLSCFSHVQLFATIWIICISSVHGFSRQEYCSGLSCPPPENLPGPGIEPTSLTTSASAGRLFTAKATLEALRTCIGTCKINWKPMSFNDLSFTLVKYLRKKLTFRQYPNMLSKNQSNLF